jgi:hypothetical protein
VPRRGPNWQGEPVKLVPDSDYRGSVIVVLRNDNAHQVQLFGGRSYVQLVPTPYFADRVGEFNCLRHHGQTPPPPPAPSSSPLGQLDPLEEDELVSFLADIEAKEGVRGEGGFGSTDWITHPRR